MVGGEQQDLHSPWVCREAGSQETNLRIAAKMLHDLQTATWPTEGGQEMICARQSRGRHPAQDQRMQGDMLLACRWSVERRGGAFVGRETGVWRSQFWRCLAGTNREKKKKRRMDGQQGGRTERNEIGHTLRLMQLGRVMLSVSV